MTSMIVVGAGPVGVAMALDCARRGFEVVVVERETDIHPLPRAIVMDDEVQRALTLAGATDIGSVTSPLDGAEFIDVTGARIIGIDVPPGLVTGAGFPPVVRYYQPELEMFLRDHATRAGVQFLLGEEVISIAQSHHGTEAHLASGRVLHGTWMVAADGAASTIRKALGVPFESLGFDQDWLVVDVRLRDGAEPILPTLVQQICDPARPSTYVPGHDRYRRWEFQLQEGESRESMTDPGRVWSLLAPWISEDEAELVRAVVYRFHATVAASMRVGRVFLVGDAAHQMPPFLGQGLCTGIRDVANLSWKLQMVEAGLAADALLDTYDAERRPHATAVVAHAADMGRLIDHLAGRADGQDDLTAAYGGQRPFPRLEHGLLVAGHPLVGHRVPDITLDDGRRFDSAVGGGFAVVVPAERRSDPQAIARWQSLGAAVVAGSVPFAEGTVVVRPDRAIAAVSTTDEEFVAHTDELLQVFG